MRIVRDVITLEDLKAMAATGFGTLVKAVDDAGIRDRIRDILWKMGTDLMFRRGK